ncbi:MAG: exostosin family protein [bacterium]
MFSFYIHDFHEFKGKVRWQYDRALLDRWCNEANLALRTYPQRTVNSEDADVFVVSSTLQCLSFFKQHSWTVRRHLKQLPHRHSRKPHIIFDFTDDPTPLIDSLPIFMKVDNIIVCKSALHETTYHPDIHVAIPQFPRYRFDRPPPQVSERPVLASFKGNLRSNHTEVRKKILDLNKNDRIVISPGIVTASTIGIRDDGKFYEEQQASPDSYTSLLYRSKFAILPRGHGYALSYRMIESMNAGCIPVIISDGYILPFQHIIDYSKCSIRISESEIDSLPQILESRESDAQSMQRNVLDYYERYFSTTEKIIHTSLDQCAELLNE